MPATDPAILAKLQTLWGEPVTEATAETDSQAAFVPFEWQPSPNPPARLADAPASWDASTAKLIDWFQANRDRLPSEPFDLKPGTVCGWLIPRFGIERSTPTPKADQRSVGSQPLRHKRQKAPARARFVVYVVTPHG